MEVQHCSVDICRGVTVKAIGVQCISVVQHQAAPADVREGRGELFDGG